MPDDPDPRRDESEELTTRPANMPKSDPKKPAEKRVEPGERETRPCGS